MIYFNRTNRSPLAAATALRHVLAVAACIACCSPALAILTPHQGPSSRAGQAFARSGGIPAVFTQEEAYQVTDQTEVTLNGRRCRYDEVPDTAEIIFMEIDSDVSRHVLRIDFRTRK